MSDGKFGSINDVDEQSDKKNTQEIHIDCDLNIHYKNISYK